MVGDDVGGRRIGQERLEDMRTDRSMDRNLDRDMDISYMMMTIIRVGYRI